MATRTIPPPRRAASTMGGARPMAAGKLLVVGAVALGMAALMNSETLLEIAERQPLDSVTRTVGLAVAKPLHSLAELTRLDRPGEWVDDLRGLNTDGEVTFSELAAGAAAAGGATQAGDAATAGDAPAAPGSVPAVSESTVPQTTLPAGPPSAENPLRVYIAGDSLAQGYGEGLASDVADSDVMDVKTRFKVSSGLTRPDFYNWPAVLQEDVETYQPQVVIVTFGGNDGQALKTDDGTTYAPGDPSWVKVYAERVGQTMDYLSSGGRTLIWVGVPNARSESLAERMTTIRSVVEQEAAKRPGVVLVDSWELFQSPTGGYADYVADDDGKAKQMRANDGFHLSWDGARKLARHVYDEIEADLVARGGTP